MGSELHGKNQRNKKLRQFCDLFLNIGWIVGIFLYKYQKIEQWHVLIITLCICSFNLIMIWSMDSNDELGDLLWVRLVAFCYICLSRLSQEAEEIMEPEESEQND